MKRLAGYFLCFLGLCVMFTATYYLSFRNALHKFNEDAVERDYNLMKSLEEYKKQEQIFSSAETNSTDDTKNASNSDQAGILSDTKSPNILENPNGYNSSTLQGDSMTVEADQGTAILPSTKYYLETYEISTNDLIRQSLSTPSDLIGLTREEVIRKLANYMLNIPIDEYEKGLVSYELLSFSAQEIVLRKTYNSEKITFKYYVAVKDGKVIVYYSDLKTVYEYTNIEAIMLPEEARNDLMKGIYVKDNDELFSLLESYSS